jgi:hypothetical protein
MKRIRIDARQSDLDELQDILHYFVEYHILSYQQKDVLEALKLAIIDATKRRIETSKDIQHYGK